MHVERGFFNWGVFLIAVGAMPLAVRAWPIGLVVAGIVLLVLAIRPGARERNRRTR
jgi:hypothetical protein